MRYIWQREYQDKLLQWAALHGKTFDFRDPANGARAIGVVVGNKLVAVCIYHHFRGHDIEMSIIAESAHWAMPSAMRFLFRYPFTQLGLPRVTALIARKNSPARRLVDYLGFKLEGTCRRAWDGKQDCMVYGMLREECRWLDVIKASERSEGDGQEERRVA